MTQEMLDAALRSDFAVFAQKVFRTLHPGARFYANWHIDAMTHHLEQVQTGVEKRLIINVPPRSLKSMLTSVALPAFILGHDPGARLICVSYTQPLASKLSRDSRRILDSRWYRRIFPRTIVGKDTEEILETTLGGARVSTSIGAVVTGFGAGTIIIDDPMKPDEAPSQAAQERVIRFYRETLFSRLDSKVEGRIILVMQRLHENDLSGYLLRDGGWTHLKLPAIAVADEEIALGRGEPHIRHVGDVLHREREPFSALDELRRNLGSAAFEAQYQQTPVPQTGNLIKREWLQFYDHCPSRQPDDLTVQSWDTAMKGDEHNDYSVCTTWRVRNGTFMLLDVVRRHCDYPTLVRLVVAKRDAFNADTILVEDHGSGTSLIQDLRANYGIHPIGVRPEGDKVMRLQTASRFFESGQVELPKEAHWLAEFLDELLRFPQSRFDDQVDSVSQFLLWQRRSPSVFEADFLHDPEGYVPYPLLHPLSL